MKDYNTAVVLDRIDELKRLRLYNSQVAKHLGLTTGQVAGLLKRRADKQLVIVQASYNPVLNGVWAEWHRKKLHYQVSLGINNLGLGGSRAMQVPRKVLMSQL